MNFVRRLTSLCVVLSGCAGAALVVGCSQPRMAAPADVNQGVEELPVDGRSAASGMFVNEDFKIQPYQVVSVSRGAKHTSKFGALGAFKTNAESGYSFEFANGGNHVHGECTSEAMEKGFSLGSSTFSKQSAKLGCACGNEATPAATVVMTSDNGAKSYGGTLKAHAGAFELKAIYDREGGALSDGTPAGYRVDGNGQFIAAVDVLGKGRVWLQKALPSEQRADVACLFAGLLLFKPPKE